MRPKQLTVKLRVEFGPGIPVDVSAFHQPHALKAILDAFVQAMTETRLYPPKTEFDAESNGITVYLTPTKTNVRAEPSVPTTHHIEMEAMVKLEGKESPSDTGLSRFYFSFPTDRHVLDEIKKGSRHTSIVPVLPSYAYALKPGAKVTFVEARMDPIGDPVPLPRGEHLTVTLTQANDAQYQWGGQQLYSIAWDPSKVTPSSDASE